MPALIYRSTKSYKMVNLHHVQSVSLTVLLVICLLPCCNLMKLEEDENGQFKEDENGFYYADGKWCGKCPAGEFVFKDCIRNFTKAQCKRCSRGTFSMYLDRAISCKDCKTCELNQDKITDCTTMSDTVCVCRDNLYDVPDLGCIPKPSTSSTPSTSTSYVFPGCPEGMYRDYTANLNCLPCSNCSTEIQPCNSTNDAICKNISNKNEASSQIKILYVMIVCIVLSIMICGVVFYCTRQGRNKKSKSFGGEDGSVCQVEMEALNNSVQNVQ